MSTPKCEKLDEYLTGSLPAREAAGFEAHLAGCPACRDGIGEQSRVDRLLAAASREESVPASLVDRIEGRIRILARRRAARLGWFGVSAAAVVMAALGVWLAGRDRGTPPRAEPIAHRPIESAPAKHDDVPRPDAAPAPERATVDAPRARVALADPSDGILFPLESSHPNVSIVWVYPTVKPARGASRPAAAPRNIP
jgi:anti-sigma factor RsiW